MLQAIILYNFQFPRKLMNQTWKNDKKPNFLGPQTFFEGFTSTSS